MTAPDRVKAIEFTLENAQGDQNTFYYKVYENGKVVAAGDDGWDEDSDSHTVQADVMVEHVSGKQQTAQMTGDEHRAMENFGDLGKLFERVVAGESLEQVVRQVADAALAAEEADQQRAVARARKPSN